MHPESSARAVPSTPSARLAPALILAFALGPAFAAPGTASEDEDAKAPRRPNIVFVLSDDHTSQAWGIYGGILAPFAQNENIARLAREGAQLENAFCTNSICVPSRASILTGQYSHRNGVRTLRDALDPERDNVAKRLRAAGYATALVGKWHLKTPPRGFDYWNIIRGQGRYRSPVLFEMQLEKGEPQRGKYSTDVFTDHALRWLDRRPEGKPFALMLHFKATHEPWQFPKRFAKLYEGIRFPEPKDLHGATGPDGSRIPGWPLEILTRRMTKRSDHGDGRLVLESDEPKEIRSATYQKFVRDYLRCAAAIDDNLGRVLDYLDEHDLSEDTVVIYTSDQGYFLGEHNYFDKRFMLEQSLRMPFVVRYPREIRPGTRLEAFVLNIDFAPLFLDYAGADAPSSMQGRSFRLLLSGRSIEDWREAVYYRYFEDSPQRPSHFGVRTKTHKLIYYDGLESKPDAERWELYDLVEDPSELRNVYDDAAYAATTKALEATLEGLQMQFGDSR